MRDSSVGLRPWGLTRWLQIRVPTGSLEVYLAVNFMVREINQGAHKLSQTSKVIQKKNSQKEKKVLPHVQPHIMLVIIRVGYGS